MKTKMGKARTFLFFGIGILVLVGVCSSVRPALAQEACPLPAGVTPPPDPSVTAQQVEDGSGALAEFTRVARDYIKGQIQSDQSISLTQAAYQGCLSRQDDGIWRSGSTYFVMLTPDGRLLSHPKDMTLAGRLLNPVIYVRILAALGVPLTDLINLASPDSATAARAIDAVMRTLTQEPDAPFDATFSMPGLAGIPGASGHAAVYVSRAFQAPILVLAGFDIDESHLIPISDEDIDYGAPSVTAEDVVDRETLKTFVAEAWNFIEQTSETHGALGSVKTNLALGDPNGPWRHGSVYLYILDRTSNIIVFHGAFPDRYELLPLVPIARDPVTGKLVLPQVLAAAASNPEEGGFVAYHFDDPTDDSDSADTLKVGYARDFSLAVDLPDGTAVTADITVGSGFYLNSDSPLVQRLLEELQTSMLFGITTPEDGDVVAGNAVVVSVTGAPTETVHFAYRPPDAQDGKFIYLGAALNRADVARFAWNTQDLPDGDYELVVMYTEDDGDSVVDHAIKVSVDNVDPAETPDIVEDRGRKTQALQAGRPHEVVTADGVAVTLPPGALAGDDRITIDAADPPRPATAPGDAVGAGVDISLASGQDTFREAVTISLPYAEWVLDEMDIAEGGLSMWRFDAETGDWALVPGSMVQPDADRVVADVTQTGEYGIFNVAPLPGERQ